MSSRPPTLSAPVAACYLVKSTNSRSGSLLATALDVIDSSSSFSSASCYSYWRDAAFLAAMSYALKIVDDLHKYNESDV